MQNTSRKSCGHCRNLHLEGWENHHVRACPNLAKTICRNCNEHGHTSGYCPNVRKQQSDPTPVVNGWANIAKKAMTPEDQAINYAFEAKIKSDTAEKKRKEHEAYLERKERRESIAKMKKEREDAAYAIYRQHMWYKYGHKWYFKFEEGTEGSNEIPDPFYNRVQQEIQEYYRVYYEMQDEAEKERKQKEATKAAAKAAEKAEKKATLSPEEYRKWKREKMLQEEDENEECFYNGLDDWLDRGWCDYTQEKWITNQREANGKIWLEEMMQAGKIVIGKDGKYKYYA